MKIALTGGGTGGHFYPLIAVAEAIHQTVDERNLIEPQLYYIGPAAFDSAALVEQEITYIESPAGRTRRYASILNVLDIFKTGWGIVRATTQLFRLFPDVIFSTGGFAAFPTLFAARILHIPVVIYDADAAPGRVSLWSSKFAMWIAVAHPEATEQFPTPVREKIARTGHPIRHEIENPSKEGGHEFMKLDSSVPTIFVMGGSQGAQAINSTVIDALPNLVTKYNIVHQTGRANLDDIEQLSRVVLRNSQYANRYRAFGLLNTLALRMVSGVTTIVVARAGSGTIFEIAQWGLPSILIPLPKDVSHDQIENAFSYARSGAASVLEQKNLTPHLLTAEIDRLVNDKTARDKMSAAARAYARPQAAKRIADILIETALTHEKS